MSTQVGEGPGETHALLGSAPDREMTSGPRTPEDGAASPGEQEPGGRLQAEDVGREALLFLLLFPQRLPRGSPEGGLRLLPMVWAGGRAVREGASPGQGPGVVS